jgi:3-deoxy-D-manno-octulosonate 8-phosphate phosphatase (KDO 8-P phosphatase)
MNPNVEALAAKVGGVVLDVDGVLTNGQIVYSDRGDELKFFHVQDGASIKLLMRSGIEVAIISGRNSSAVSRRAEELGIKHVLQGASCKSQALDTLINDGFIDHDLCAIGDDLADLDLYARAEVILKATVANAHPAVLTQADFTTQRQGGEGATVELVELILKSQGRWDLE